MRVYIAYKYRAVEDKDELIKNLELISGAITALEHSPFVLGRDIQRWHATASSVYKTIPHIIVNILKSDLVFAFINSEVKSHGLSFELFCAKLFGKPIVLAKRTGTAFDFNGLRPVQSLDFNDLQDLLKKISILKL